MEVGRSHAAFWKRFIDRVASLARRITVVRMPDDVDQLERKRRHRLKIRPRKFGELS
jgi:hypothetical protein